MIGQKIYPIVVGQIIVGCCERKNRDTFKKHCLQSKLVIAMPQNFDCDDQGQNFCQSFIDNVNNKIREISYIQDANIKFDKLLLYQTDGNYESSRDKYDTRAVAIIQNEMTDLEQLVVRDELCAKHKLDDGHWLIKDGSLEYNPRFSNMDVTQINRFRANYEHVVSVSKHFDPELIRDYRNNRMSKTISELPPFHRTKVYRFCDPDNQHYAIWYLRLRGNKNYQRETCFSDVVKCEMILSKEDKKIDTELINELSAEIIREAYPVCYGNDSRWANHLYPVYLTETFCKSNYINSNIILSLF